MTKDESARAMLDDQPAQTRPRRQCEPPPVPGVWVVYDWDNGPYLISIHTTSDAAAKATAGTGYGRIARVPFDVPFGDGIKTWEGR